jgi:hypothetical protein
MKPLHAGLGITDSDWSVFVGIIRRTLDELMVGNREQADWLTLFEQQFKPAIVEKG